MRPTPPAERLLDALLLERREPTATNFTVPKICRRSCELRSALEKAILEQRGVMDQFDPQSQQWD